MSGCDELVVSEAEWVARAALAAIYSGADIDEARALLDQFEDHGYALTPRNPK